MTNGSTPEHPHLPNDPDRMPAPEELQTSEHEAVTRPIDQMKRYLTEVAGLVRYLNRKGEDPEAGPVITGQVDLLNRRIAALPVVDQELIRAAYPLDGREPEPLEELTELWEADSPEAFQREVDRALEKLVS